MPLQQIRIACALKDQWPDHYAVERVLQRRNNRKAKQDSSKHITGIIIYKIYNRKPAYNNPELGARGQTRVIIFNSVTYSERG